MKRRDCRRRAQLSRRTGDARGFTLVELMVAMVAGLFVAIAVFTLAKHASAFAMRQSRVADATLQSVIGFERLKADIARAGFLSTPNITRDPSVCRGPLSDPSYPSGLLSLASVQIGAASGASTESTNNGLAPKSITLAGSYDSADLFVARNITQGSPVVYLARNSLGMANIGYQPLTGAAALGRVFKTGRALRIVDDAGGVQFARIAGVQGGDQPRITLEPAPGVQFRGTNVTDRCGVRGHGNDFVNVVNIIRYDIRDLSATGALGAMYQGGPSYEATRRELIREELDLDGNADAGSLELVAEYAVDLDFTLLVADSPTASLTRVTGANVATYAGDVQTLGGSSGPQRIRALHAWLSVRSQEADRTTGLPLPSTAPGPNLLRISVNPTNGTLPPFARVRTLQSTIFLPNQARATWP
jgi:prepilin-type N-terminal cleavage/methylation domain-containing protein